MDESTGPVYEFTCTVDAEAVERFENWLARHVAETLEDPGIARTEIYRQDDDEAGRARRVIHYYFYSDQELERFLAGRPEQSAALEAFEDQLSTTHRILRHTDIADGEMKPAELCLNCGVTLSGQYCGNCGQRATSRLISVWELLRDAFGDLFDMDSRLWRTLWPLIARPGKLTRDYLEGRRARFMPPFRTYLVLSIVFFVAAFFDPREELNILFEPEAPPVAGAPEADDGPTVEITNDGIQVSEGDDEDVVDSDDDEADDDDGEISISFNDDGVEQDCDIDDLDTSEWPAWLSSRLTKERLQVACDRVIADDGRAFGEKLLDNVPAALFVLLPLMALVLKVLYPLSKRYYVEHLLFVVHYHAFVFLILTLQVLLSRLGPLVRLPELITDVTVLTVSLYVPVYLFKGLRRVYGQGALLTTLKFLILMLAYFFGLVFIFALVALLAAFSI